MAALHETVCNSAETVISALGGEATIRWVAATLVWQLGELSLRKIGQMARRAYCSSAPPQEVVMQVLPTRGLVGAESGAERNGSPTNAEGCMVTAASMKASL